MTDNFLSAFRLRRFLGKKDIVFVERTYHPELNAYIDTHLDEISDAIQKKGFRFRYLPSIARQVASEEVLRYNYPYLKADEMVFSTEQLCALNQVLVDDSCGEAGLLRDGHFTPLETQNILWMEFELQEFIAHLKEPVVPRISHRICSKNMEMEIFEVEENESQSACTVNNRPMSFKEAKVEDKGCEESEDEMMQEVRRRIQALRKLGVEEAVLRSLLHPEVKLSRIYINKRYDIFLPDYDNMEIEMGPLPKAVFLLYLRHPEGIAFKNLSDYQQELFELYGKVSGRGSVEQMKQSIADVVDPTKNAINEKCTRVREAFISRFDEYLARNYFIVGQRGEAKKITLDRSLVVWE